MEVVVVQHPLAQDRLGRLRHAGTGTAEFRHHLRVLAQVLLHEATRDLPTRAVQVPTPLETTEAVQLEQPPLLVPVLRAGLGMLDAALELLPDARVGFVGVQRDEETFRPLSYLNSLPDRLEGVPVLILEPMLATGNSLLHVCELLAAAGAGTMTAVCVLASRPGVETLERSEMDLRLVTAGVDPLLNEQAFIVPGLGDAGDRQFDAP